MSKNDLMTKIVSLCKRRGFVFKSSDIYGGLKSAYDYGPLGVELKRNIANAWWRSMVYERENVVGLDASNYHAPKSLGIFRTPCWFLDPLVDCYNCKERFRADKAPQLAEGTEVEYRIGGKPDGQKKKGTVTAKGYVCPICSSPDFSEERQFNRMFRTTLGPVDPMSDFVKVYGKDLSQDEFKKKN